MRNHQHFNCNCIVETLGQLAVENGNQCIAKWSSKAKSLSMELWHPCRTNNKGRNKRNMKVFSTNKSLSSFGRCERLYLGGSVLLNLTFDSRFVLNFQKIFPLDDVDMKHSFESFYLRTQSRKGTSKRSSQVKVHQPG